MISIFPDHCSLLSAERSVNLSRQTAGSGGQQRVHHIERGAADGRAEDGTGAAGGKAIAPVIDERQCFGAGADALQLFLQGTAVA